MPKLEQKKKSRIFWSYIIVLSIVTGIGFLWVYEKHEIVVYKSNGFPAEISSWNLLTGKKKIEVLDNDGGISFYYYPLDSPKSGLYEEFYPNAVLRYQCTYVNDSLHGPCFEYYPSGNKMSLTYYVNNLPSDSTYAWYESGTLLSKGYYRNGRRDGRLVSFHPNGKVFMDGFIRDGKDVGDCFFFDSFGHVTDTLPYGE